MRTQQNSSKNVQTNNVAAAQQLLTAPVAQQQAGVAPQQQAAPVAPQQPVAMVTPVVTVVQPGSVAAVQLTAVQQLRANRVAKVQVGRVQQYRAAKLLAHHTATQASLQATLHAQVLALYAQAGMQPPTQSMRAVPVTQKAPASTIPNVCAAIRAYVHANPTASKAAVIKHFGSAANPHTVSTQYQRAKSGVA